MNKRNKTEAKLVEKRLRRITDEERQLFNTSDEGLVHILAATADLQLDPQSLILFLENTINPYITSLKMFFNRARPWKLSNFIKDNRLESRTVFTASYPSGHSTQSMFLAFELARLYPDKKNELIALADKIGQSRIAAGHHYPTDHEKGKVLALDFSDKFKYDILKYI